MNKVYNSITDLIGNTPIVKLNKLVEENSAEVYVKLEWYNPGSSVKDRIALNMIEAAEKAGKIKPGDTIIEPTSGNTGIGLAMIGAAKGYRVILTMPDTMSIERRKLLKAFGAELILTPGTEGMTGAINKAKELVEKEGYFLPQQFENPANPEIHRQTTGKEILEAMGTDLDAFVAGVGTGGTITGCGEVLKEAIPNIEIVAVEPATSPVLSGEKKGPHGIQGIGAGFVPEVLNTQIYDSIEKITDNEAMETARKMAKEEGILVGISSGAAVAAALKVAKRLGKGKKVLAISPSYGERYLSTALFNEE
ncbi:cysteine synthase A [Defluviitalea phaphyphila]|uniref:cysteine synthase A n=1 Tax=Defluviitalea phaphyphila TaxID=1473580 RepID=UPI0007310098|nr:cysteine synthase A [Defluviitalea phaphyphila]